MRLGAGLVGGDALNQLAQHDHAAIGRRLRARRLERHLSQAKLGEALGVTAQQVQKYEKGQTPLAQVKLAKAAAALGTTISELTNARLTGGISEQVLAQLATPGSVELLTLYAQIGDARTRRALLLIVQSMTGGGISTPS